MDTSIIVALIALLATISATIYQQYQQRLLANRSRQNEREIRRLEESFQRQRESQEFLNNRLSKLYLPVSMHLMATRNLANIHYDAGVYSQEDVERALHKHNSAILDCLMNQTIYLDPGAPEEATTDLIKHLLEWNTVYDLKYEHKQFDRPIWDGIREFGYSKFPDGAADYFHEMTKRLRKELHTRFQLSD